MILTAFAPVRIQQRSIRVRVWSPGMRTHVPVVSVTLYWAADKATSSIMIHASEFYRLKDKQQQCSFGDAYYKFYLLTQYMYINGSLLCYFW